MNDVTTRNVRPGNRCESVQSGNPGADSSEILSLHCHPHPLMSALLRVLAAVAVLLIASVGAELVSSKLRIMQINARAQGWVAGENPAFEGKTLEDVIALLARSSTAAPASATEAEAEDAVDEAPASASASSLIQISSQQQHADDDLPAEFDPRVSHPACLAGVFDQGRCGSCWVVAALHSWTDRACIAVQRFAQSGVAPRHLKLSELDITSHTNGCKGGSAADAFKFLVEHGVVTAACQPYGVWERPIAGPIPTCEKQPCASHFSILRIGGSFLNRFGSAILCCCFFCILGVYSGRPTGHICRYARANRTVCGWLWSDV